MHNQLEQEFIAMIRDEKENFYKLAYSYMKNNEDALDAIGESTYKAFISLPKLRDKNYMKTWFCRIVINECNKLHKKNKRLTFDTEFTESIPEKEDKTDEISDLHSEIDKLPEKYRTIIILKYIKQMKIEEMADVLGLNSNTVKTRLKRGIDKLKVLMGGSYG